MENKALIEQYYSAFAKHDLNEARTMLADNFTFRGPIMEASSADDMMEKMSAFGCDYKSEVHDMLCEKDRVVVNFTCTFSAPFEATLDMCEWFTIRDGKIASSELFYDASKMPALGLS